MNCTKVSLCFIIDAIEEFDVSPSGLIFMGDSNGNISLSKIEGNKLQLICSKQSELMTYTKLKVLKDGSLLAIDRMQHDVRIFDQKLNLVNTVSGTPLPSSWGSYAHTYAKLSCSDYSSEEDVFIWMNGPNTACFFDCNTLSQTDITGLWLDPAGTYSFGLVTVPSYDQKKVAGLGLASGTSALHIYDISSGTVVLKSNYCASITRSNIESHYSSPSKITSLFERLFCSDTWRWN